MNITDKEIKQFGLNIDKSLKDLSNKRSQQDLDNLESWQDGSLINKDTINKMSLDELTALAKILEGVK